MCVYSCMYLHRHAHELTRKVFGRGRCASHMRMCVYACLCVSLHVCVYMRVYAYMRPFPGLCMYACMCVYVRICVHMHACACMPAYACMRVYACICAYVRARVHIQQQVQSNRSLTTTMGPTTLATLPPPTSAGGAYRSLYGCQGTRGA